MRWLREVKNSLTEKYSKIMLSRILYRKYCNILINETFEIERKGKKHTFYFQVNQSRIPIVPTNKMDTFIYCNIKLQSFSVR